MVETLECEDGMLIGSRFGSVSELTTRGTAPPLFPISGSSIEQRGYKKVHWTECGFNTLVESSGLVHVMSVFSLERNGTSVAFTCSGDCDPSRQPKSLLQPAGVSLLTDRMRSGTYWMQANWQVTVEGKASVNKLAEVFPSQSTTVQDDGATSSTDVAEPVTDYTEVYKTTESVSVEQGQLLQAAEPDQCVLKVKTQRQGDIVEFTHSLLGVNGKAADDFYKTTESVSVEEGQLLQAAEPDQCVLKVKTQRQGDIVEFTHSLLGVNGKAADDLHRRRRDSDD